MNLMPQAPDTWARLCLRALLWLCCGLVAAYIWSEFQGHSFSTAVPAYARTLTMWAGVALFVFALGYVRVDRRLGLWGLGIGLLAMSRGLLPY